MKTKIKFILAFLLFFLPLLARADSGVSVSITPSLIDVKCEKREMLEYKIKIKNNSAVRADIYAQVNDISPDTGLVNYSDPSELDQNASLTRWISFYRAMIQVRPGEEVEQSLQISVSPDAVPGKYHAMISFPTGLNLTEAQKAADEFNEAKLLINLEVAAHKVEQVEISQFKPAKKLFTANPIGFTLNLKNIGTEIVNPSGEVVVYNKSGKEVGSVKVPGGLLAAGETKDFSVSEKLKLMPGKYKAKLQLSYGENNKDLSDIIYFSYLPTIFLIIFIVVLVGFSYAMILFLNKRRKRSWAAVLPETVDDRQAFQEESDKILPNGRMIHKKYVINLKKN
jgi:hypothetical protein